MTEADNSETKPGESIRQLIRDADHATLSTTERGGGGWPYGSLVLAACDHDAAPLIFISDLADHTKNIAEDDRVCLLYDNTAGLEDPLTGARASILGRAHPIEDARLLERYVRRHPSAELYKSFTDFNLYRVEIERAHLVAGFGRIHWVGGDKVLVAASEALQAAEADIIEHMNSDHADALQLYAAQLDDQDGEGWIMTGIDGEGCDLRSGGKVSRVAFESLVIDGPSARAELVGLAKKARG